MQKIHIPEIKSTNTYMLELLAEGTLTGEMTVIYSMRQTAGRGQIGNSWESEAEKNITFSILLRPSFLPVREQFLISEITCLAIVNALKCFAPNAPFSVKWPNDIYCGNEKICGILIENSLMGSHINYSVVGIGINVNQERWIGNAPNPTSLKLCSGAEHSPIDVLDKVVANIASLYEQLKNGDKQQLHAQYFNCIYRRNGFFPYKDAETGREFNARIKEIEPSGYLHLEDTEGSIHRYMFKEVKFVLPCGVTKE